MKKADKLDLVEILRMWVYPDQPKRSDKWIMGRSLFAALKDWAEEIQKGRAEERGK